MTKPETDFIPETDDQPRNLYARVGWTVEDVTSMFDLTAEQARAWLDRNAKYIQDAMVERGWVAIESLGLEDGLKKLEDEDDDPQ